MNVFALHPEPAGAARAHADQHINKMLLEAVQIASTVAATLSLPAPYRATHARHPCTLWAAAGAENLRWLLALADALRIERRMRWTACQPSKTEAALDTLDRTALFAALPQTVTPFAQAMPDEYKGPDAVPAYRTYYRERKAILCGRPARWTNRKIPDWFLKQ
jgi:hypothetical protein